MGAKVLGVLLGARDAHPAAVRRRGARPGGAQGITFGTFSAGAMLNPGLLGILGFGFAAFMGFESTALYREEARDPERTIPRATYISVAFMAVFYGFVVWAVIVAVGETHVQAAAAKNTAGLVFPEAGVYLGPWAEFTMYLLIITSVYASQLAFHNAINRYTFSLARDGALPRVLHRTNRSGSPAASGLRRPCSPLVVVLFFAAINGDPYLQLLLWVNSPGVIGIVALQVITCVARRRVLPAPPRARPQVVRDPVPRSSAALAMFGCALPARAPISTCSPRAARSSTGSSWLRVPWSSRPACVLAVVWKRTRPDVYRAIGGSESAERARDEQRRPIRPRAHGRHRAHPRRRRRCASAGTRAIGIRDGIIAASPSARRGARGRVGRRRRSGRSTSATRRVTAGFVDAHIHPIIGPVDHPRARPLRHHRHGRRPGAQSRTTSPPIPTTTGCSAGASTRRSSRAERTATTPRRRRRRPQGLHHAVRRPLGARLAARRSRRRECAGTRRSPTRPRSGCDAERPARTGCSTSSRRRTWCSTHIPALSFETAGGTAQRAARAGWPPPGSSPARCST